jgi:hypothetical protein
MPANLFDGGLNLAIFGLTALVVVGLFLLSYRIGDAAKRRKAKLEVVGEAGPAPASPIDGPSIVEIQLRDANQALFMVLMDCCNMILEVEQGSPVAKSDAHTYASNIRQSGRTTMSNKEIADHSYQLSADLRPLSDPAMVATRRVLTQLALAERWEATLRGGISGGRPGS